jgi:hypothetical protein
VEIKGTGDAAQRERRCKERDKENANNGKRRWERRVDSWLSGVWQNVGFVGFREVSIWGFFVVCQGLVKNKGMGNANSGKGDAKKGKGERK